MERHSNRHAVGDGALIRVQNVCLSGSKSAWWLSRYYILGMFQTNPEEDVTFSRPPTVTSSGGE